jgi:hypothetical protein
MDPEPDLVGGIGGAAHDASWRSPLGVFPNCPLCDGDLHPEHAHYRCRRCGWRDSCCD